MKVGPPGRTRLGAIVVAGAMLAFGLSGTGAATADDQARAGKTKILMDAVKGEDVFVGPSTVKQGSKLEVVNESNPRKRGPHTFSIVKRKLLPQTKTDGKKCFSKGVCGAIGVAHEFDPETGQVNKPTVEVGETGWDRAFTLDRVGDSWYTDEKGAKQSRMVSAQPGTKLFFICAVHPFMQGKIEVVR